MNPLLKLSLLVGLGVCSPFAMAHAADPECAGKINGYFCKVSHR